MACQGGIFHSKHPLVLHKLAKIRQDVSCREFRTLLKELTLLLGYEAARDLQVKLYTVSSSLRLGFFCCVINAEAETVALF